ncbi:Site-specific recombinase XerD [Singulisphaera sp. GP187]|uniref:tyrosine-type recombinase/integrase n=1 Tax=Singulisphaera sp. GP187 TaxID=1882752 RepID=UPI00092B53D1|nr:site-specific integrase [Singulisphaera sp. GP187]SIO67782.1 Site-specific recombinase XerD [Singulisphaera sp. GP187]
MPAKTALTWEQGTRRWKKVYMGKSYTVSCRALGVPGTKLESYQAANAWWAAKKTEIDGQPPSHAYQQILDELERRKAWAVASAPDQVPRLEETIAEVRGQEVAELSNSAASAFWLGGDAGQVVWSDRLARSHIPTLPADRTIAFQMERYLALEQVRTESGQLSVSEFDTVRRCLHAFRDHLGGSNPVDYLDADRWEGWWSALVSQAISTEYKKKRLRIARSFVSWLAEKGLIPVPPNLHSRRHRFGGGSRSVATIPVKEVAKLITAAPGQLKLHLLLMINCGMTQIDISDLHPSEVDWKRGRIKRKRSKTEDHEHVPTVEYPLWPRTWELLQRFGQKSGERVLQTESGKPWLRDVLRNDGKRSKVDAIKSNYVHLQRKIGLEHSMKLLRKTSATLIESHASYGRYVGHFLGHSPRTLAERHYAAPSVDLFDKIVNWLGKQYGPVAAFEEN